MESVLLFSFKQLKRSVVHKQVPWKKDEFTIFYWCSWLFYVHILRYFLTSGLHVSIIDAALPLVTILFQRSFKRKIQLNYWIGIVLGLLITSYYPSI